jgi:hypothetical protein
MKTKVSLILFGMIIGSIIPIVGDAHSVSAVLHSSHDF